MFTIYYLGYSQKAETTYLLNRLDNLWNTSVVAGLLNKSYEVIIIVYLYFITIYFGNPLIFNWRLGRGLPTHMLFHRMLPI